jgi:hypothetical protein
LGTAERLRSHGGLPGQPWQRWRHQSTAATACSDRCLVSRIGAGHPDLAVLSD